MFEARIAVTVTAPVAALVSAIGETDCEQLGAGFLIQPVNAVSSLAYTVVGLAMVRWAGEPSGRERWIRLLFVFGMTATGIGSLLYHGPQWAGSHFVHDITFLVVVLVLGVADVATARGWDDRTLVVVLGCLSAVAAVALIVIPEATNVMTVLAIAFLIVGDIALFGDGGRGSTAYRFALILAVLAVASMLLGRTGSPLCAPESPFQAHALWHLLSAAALAAYAVATGERRRAAAEMAR